MVLLFCIGLDFDEMLRVNLADYDIFSAVPFAVGEDGAFVLCDRNQGQLLFLDQNGKNPRRVARQGQGPGELQTPVLVQWMAKEQAFAVGDFGNRRLSYWSPSGTLLREAPYPGGTIFFFQFAAPDKLVFTRDPAGHFEGKPRLGVFDAASGNETLIWHHPLDKPMAVTAADLPEGRIARLLRWDPRLVFGIGSNFVAVAWSESSKIHRVDLAGHPIGSPFSAELPQKEVTSEDVQRQLDDFDSSYRDSLKAHMVMRDYWPAMSAIVIDRLDRIWVFGFSQIPGETVDFRVFDASGNSLEKGKAPGVAAVIKSDQMFYMLQDEEEDVQLIKVQFDLSP